MNPPPVASPLPAGWDLPHTEVYWRGSPPSRAAQTPLAIAIGMFDGVHLGHQAVLESAVTHARQLRGLAGVLTFDPHPSRLFRPSDPTRLLQPPTQKVEELFARGMDLVLLKNFEATFAALSAEDFLPALKAALPRLRSVHVGENFRFGRGRSGDIAALVASGRPLGVDVFSVDRIRYNGEPVSSSRLREALAAGEMAAVNTMLGYDYYSHGPVVPGQRLGRQLGFPTLNFAWSPELPPRYGVYAVRVEKAGEPPAEGVANYGVRPTVAPGSPPVLEVHLLAPETTWTTGDTLRVNWLTFLRPEQRFPSLEALRTQIQTDRTQAAAYFQG